MHDEQQAHVLPMDSKGLLVWPAGVLVGAEANSIAGARAEWNGGPLT